MPYIPYITTFAYSHHSELSLSHTHALTKHLQSFAKAEFACLMAAWVAAFDTQFADAAEADKLGVGKKIDIQSGITARPKGGVRVKVVPVLE